MVLHEPLLLSPRPKATVWGGDALSKCLDQDLGGEGPVGEVWTLVDREEGSTEVARGEYAGRRLRGLMLSERTALLGRSKVTPEETFPVLLKLIDASQDLSVQVHPDRQRAKLVGDGAEPKDEFWYILDAKKDARIYLGLKPGTDVSGFASKANTPSVVDSLNEFPVRRGDCVWVPAGTVHSIGAGITLVEVQQNSDTTFRIYDWGRMGMDGEPRTCQLEKALQVIDYESAVQGPFRPEPMDSGVNQRSLLIETDEFAVEHLSVHEPLEHDTAGRAWAYIVLQGNVRLSVDEVEGDWHLHRGETWLMPASLGSYRFHSPDGEVQVLRVEAKA
ncbi:MAG: class I mannose-6-phosphate isomerase [Planctomycetota bacterium]|nr:class I mannose-6-phosphate isomerase [Planctomycetota bacterium]